jgi:hypothetical protein
MLIKTILLSSLLLGAAGVAGAQDVMRCKGSIVDRGMTAPEVLAKCGEPKAREEESVPIRVRRANGSSGIVGTTEIARWTYDRGAGQFPALLTFEDGKLTGIRLLTEQ